MGKVKPNLNTRRETHIRAWRKHRGLTLESLAERISVTPGALSQLERGDVAYTQPMLEALAHALACEPSDLISCPPGKENGLTTIRSQIPLADRPRALEILRVFTKAS
jgi:transcriptional regulator with XRE-family HTH domain